MEYGPLTRAEAIAMYAYTWNMLDIAARGEQQHRPLSDAEAEAMWLEEVDWQLEEFARLGGRQLADA